MEMEPRVVDSNGSEVEMPDLGLDNLPIEDWVESAEVWVRDNRTLALLGSFAIGVFIGVMIRD